MSAVDEFRRLAQELEFWPATTDPADIERHRRQSAQTDADYTAYLREYGPDGCKQNRWNHLRNRRADSERGHDG